MTESKGYSGWTNWETWHTSLLIDNEYDIYQKKVELLKKKASFNEFKQGLIEAERRTRKYFNENHKDNPEGWKKWEKVNWKEIYDSAQKEEYNF